MTDPSIDQLKATVHVVTIGTRELTLSKYRQLDRYGYGMVPYTFQPFGRVNAGTTYTNYQGRRINVALEILGKNHTTGTLEKIILTHEETWDMQRHSIYGQLLKEYQELPLIILGGVK